jgi:NAD(P)-dependent dehydrogenase (short-subunit alcohol dehydrogenase family)
MALVVVTGGAGALGRAVLAHLTAHDVQVVAMDRPGAALEEVGRAPGVVPVAAELADRTDVLRAWKDIDAIGAPTGLVALAGGFTPGKLAALDEETFDGLWSGNVSTLLWSAQQAAERMAPGSSIVTVGSKTAVAGPAPIGHASTKAAVVRITELLAEELRPAGIRVNSILPSVLDTPGNRSWMSAELAARAVSTEAVAKVIAFLLGPDSAPISGARIPVYGDA